MSPHAIQNLASPKNFLRTFDGSPMKDPSPTLHRLFNNAATINSRVLPDTGRRLFVDGRRSEPMSSKKEKSDSTGKEGEKSAEKAPPPPPPEKPEPGDCCGSGCVRCVWDVYYEELDAYNKLYKSDSENSTSKS